MIININYALQDDLDNFEKHIVQLQSTVETLPQEARAHPDILQRLTQTERRKAELIELSNLRKQRLVDALSLYKLLSDADALEAWIDEKGKLLNTLVPGQDLEEVSYCCAHARLDLLLVGGNYEASLQHTRGRSRRSECSESEYKTLTTDVDIHVAGGL